MAALTARQRALGTLLGATICDAAARPLHWIYKTEHLHQLLGQRDAPEFWPTSESPFYSLPTGANSCYSDLSLVMLRTLAGTKGDFDLAAFQKACLAHFGPGSEYGTALAKRHKNYDISGSDRKTWRGAVEGPWVGSVVLTMLKHMEEGVEPTGDPKADDSNGFCASLPLVALNHSAMADDDVLAQVRQVVHALVNTELCEQYTAASAQLVLCALRASPGTTVPALMPAFLERLESLQLPEVRQGVQHLMSTLHAEQQWGIACPYPETLLGALHALLTTDCAVDAVRKTIRAGGCNCSRAFLIGAVYGAMNGPGTFPTEWRDKTFASAEIADLVNSVAK